MKCNEQEDWTGDDDIYFVSVIIDGNGKVNAQQTPSWEMDTGQTRNIYWNLYPMRDPNNYLEICVRMYEVDGSYNAIGNIVTALGGVAAVASMGAGAAISAIGQIIILLGGLDPDDDLGTHGFLFNGAVNLHTSVGVINRSYLGDGADYDVRFQLIEAQ